MKYTLPVALFLSALASQACAAPNAREAGASSSHAAVAAPHINPPHIFGVRPGSPFLFRLPVSSARPMRVTAEGLPEGLKLDAATGIVTGTITSKEKRTYSVAFTATNAGGTARDTLRIVVGDRIALTPPVGWSSWYTCVDKVTQKDVIQAADAMEKSGLADAGFAYVNIDDGWQGFRGGPTKAIQPNERFPDIKGMVDHLHAKGLRAGIYTVPMAGSYAGYIGSTCLNAEGEYKGLPENKRLMPTQLFGHWPGIQKMGVAKIGPHWFFDRDVAQFSAWGFDFLKLDWGIEPVIAARASKDVSAQPRDILFSLSNSAKLKDGAALATCAQMWRTTGDLEDKWEKVLRHATETLKWGAHAGPGHWNDPDMILIGWMHDAFTQTTPVRPSRLSFEEQRSQVSLWSLLSAPLILSGDISKLTEKELSLLTNPEVLAVDQDPLGKPAVELPKAGDLRLFLKEMEDGSRVVGILNTGAKSVETELAQGALKLPSDAKLRDLWKREPAQAQGGKVRVAVPSHGCVLLRTVGVPGR